MSAEKTIRISEKHREELHGLKEVGDSYDDVIARLLDEYREKKRAELADRMDETREMDRDGFATLD